MIDSIVTPREGTRRQAPEVVQQQTAPVPAGRQSEVGGNAAAAQTAKTEAQSIANDTRQSVRETVEQVEQQIQQINRSLRFSIDDESGYTIVKVIDRDTDELIRQIPSETFLSIAKNLQEFGKGLVDESV